MIGAFSVDNGLSESKCPRFLPIVVNVRAMSLELSFNAYHSS